MIRRWMRVAFLLCLLVVVAFAGLLLLYGSLTPPSTLMLGRRLTGNPVERVVVPLTAISADVPLAIISSEDARFCQHDGVDWDALRDVMDDSDGDGPSRGASTIAMQTAKNLFLWPGRSYIRKGLELPLALASDLVWGKARMMEIYLNVAEWGEGLFGIEAAARRYFSKSARDLSRREAVLLATALPSPLRRNPARPTAGHRALAGRILARMDASGPSLAACIRPNRPS